MIKDENEEKSYDEAKNISKANVNHTLTLEGKYKLIEQFLSEDKRKTWICKELNMDIRCYDKITNMTSNERKSLFNSKSMINHRESVNKKMELVTKVRQLNKAANSNREISRRTGLSRHTVKKYLDENLNPIHASYGEKRSTGILIPYIDKVDAYLEKGLMGSAIEKARNLKIDEFKSFTNGLERDISAVKNAIKYEYNNGLAEGSINKLKFIKRIIYGRCSFETLKNKILKLQEMNSINQLWKEPLLE